MNAGYCDSERELDHTVCLVSGAGKLQPIALRYKDRNQG